MDQRDLAAGGMQARQGGARVAVSCIATGVCGA
jgi:hypothetical protein